ncbi:hypothetical protein [Aureimonas leprariae]|uniref:hypothetical protein n=1 Tax=Plantimonas leprariae TaxID=2615207 RepID=UPI001386A75C|nr:hypothetical protein [Aureimonas leprariae]
MSDLANSVKSRGLLAQVRRSMQHVRSFQVETELPKTMRDKLVELDRAITSRAAKPQ